MARISVKKAKETQRVFLARDVGQTSDNYSYMYDDCGQLSIAWGEDFHTLEELELLSAALEQMTNALDQRLR